MTALVTSAVTLVTVLFSLLSIDSMVGYTVKRSGNIECAEASLKKCIIFHCPSYEIHQHEDGIHLKRNKKCVGETERDECT